MNLIIFIRDLNRIIFIGDMKYHYLYRPIM
jgi:hypothetical protein